VAKVDHRLKWRRCRARIQSGCVRSLPGEPRDQLSQPASRLLLLVVVPERGCDLSVGERLRVGIRRIRDEADRIKGVENVHPELEVRTAGQRDFLHHAQVDAAEPRAPDKVVERRAHAVVRPDAVRPFGGAK